MFLFQITLFLFNFYVCTFHIDRNVGQFPNCRGAKVVKYTIFNINLSELKLTYRRLLLRGGSRCVEYLHFGENSYLDYLLGLY